MSGFFNPQIAEQTRKTKEHIEISEQIVCSIVKLDKSTTRLNIIMIWLSATLVLLTIVLVYLTFELVF